MSKGDKYKVRLYELTFHVEATEQQVKNLIAAILGVTSAEITGGITNVEEIEDDGQEG